MIIFSKELASPFPSSFLQKCCFDIQIAETVKWNLAYSKSYLQNILSHFDRDILIILFETYFSNLLYMNQSTCCKNTTDVSYLYKYLSSFFRSQAIWLMPKNIAHSQYPNKNSPRTHCSLSKKHEKFKHNLLLSNQV